MRNKKANKQKQLSLVEKMILEMGGTVLTLEKEQETFKLDIFVLNPEENENEK